MEEKKFPWFLRVLATNSICVQMIETFVVHKEKIICSFSNESNFALIQRHSKSLQFTKLPPLIEYLYSQSSDASTSAIKHSFFLYKSNRKEIPSSLLRSYASKKKSVPPVSYIQFSRSYLKGTIKWDVEYTDSGYKSNITPETSPSQISDQAKEISKDLISLLELHENKKIIKISLEFFIDCTSRLVLSYMPICVLSSKDQFKSANNYIKTNELSDIVNELSSPSKILKRQPSLIKVIHKKFSFYDKVEIDSPLMHKHNNSSQSQSSELGSDLEVIREAEVPSIKKIIDNNFLEILCKMRINHLLGTKKLYVSEKEMQEEEDKIIGIIEKGKNDKIRAKNSVEFKRFESQISDAKARVLEIVEVKSNRRSRSIEDLTLPVLTSRSNRVFRLRSKVLR